MKPFVKWAGGKRQILKFIRKFIDDSHDVKNDDYTYFEPFLGGGAIFFDLVPKNAVLNDLNSDLINAYNVIKSDKYNELINQLKDYSLKYKEDADGFYYEIRAYDRREDWPDAYNDVFKASRMIFLNRTCYNGLYRVNNKGQFNTPIGRYSNPLICDEDNLTQIHYFLNNSNIRIMNCSYEEVFKYVKENDIIYLDPPYDYEDDDGFTKYQMNGFTFEDFKRLKSYCDKALEKGAYVIISNNATSKVLTLFDDPNYKTFYDYNLLNTKRLINCNPSGRESGREVIFWGIPSIFPQANSIDKIIKLVLSDETILTDKEKAKEVLGVTSNRQVSYYYSSLVYLGLVTSHKKFIEDIYINKENVSAIRKIIFDKLLSKDLFNSLYVYFSNKEIDLEYIYDEVKKINSKLNNDTIKRRASTVKAWLEWMYNN